MLYSVEFDKLMQYFLFNNDMLYQPCYHIIGYGQVINNAYSCIL